jgi:fructokinase
MMSLPDLLARPVPDALVVGAGRLTLDVIVPAEAGARPLLRAGGTCGNVLTDLAYLGWQAYPILRIGDDVPGRRYAADLGLWGVHLDFVRHAAGEPTPVIVHHIRHSPGGTPAHYFTADCPFCGARLPGSQPAPVELAEEALARLPTPAVFFFDRPSPGSLRLAQAWRERGALIVFEPNHRFAADLFSAGLATAHVVKYSQQRLAGLADAMAASEPLLLVETHGANGLRYRGRGGPDGWRQLDALAAPLVRDAAGSGDWCAAGIIHALGRRGREGLEQASGAEVLAALRFGQALAAWNCVFEGARGGMDQADRPTFERAITALLGGEEVSVPALTPEAPEAEGNWFCPTCSR